MKQNPFSGLLHSRKFLVLMLDTAISLATYFVGKYVAPDASKDVLIVIAALQPVFYKMIDAIASEDNAQAHAKASVQVAEEQAKADIKINSDTANADVQIAVANSKLFDLEG